MCPLGPQRYHGSATGHARGRPIGTEKNSTFFAVARNFVCTPDPVLSDQKTTIEHLLATDSPPGDLEMNHTTCQRQTHHRNLLVTLHNQHRRSQRDSAPSVPYHLRPTKRSVPSTACQALLRRSQSSAVHHQCQRLPWLALAMATWKAGATALQTCGSRAFRTQIPRIDHGE